LESLKKVEILNTSMSKLCTFLEDNNLLNTYFFRTHCSFIVNIKYINIIKNRTIILNDYYENEIPISNSRNIQFKNMIKNNLTIFKI
jgi:DNA-binding LytR/AlgR family response regulator